MRNLSQTTITLLVLLLPVLSAHAQEVAWEINSLTPEGELEGDFRTNTFTVVNGVFIRYGDAVLTANKATVNQDTGEAEAEGGVRIQLDDQVWVGDRIRYNFKTRQMEAGDFRTGKSPLFADGHGLAADPTNHVYYATNAFITTDDVAEPVIRVRAKRVRIVPGKSFEATDAWLYIGKVPVFYFPYYRRNLDTHANNFHFTPGYRSRYGPFLLGSYNWFANDALDGSMHVDWRQERGVGLGPDFNYHLGRWGDGTLRYYYLHDENPQPDLAPSIPDNRQRVYFSYLANPFTNLTARALVRYQSDIQLTRDFFEAEYRDNPQPDSFVELNKVSPNFSLDVFVQPRVNDFFETVERLPDIKLTGFRQQIGDTPLYYQSESSLGYYRRLFAETNGVVEPDFGGWRGDTYHQVLLPKTFFGWLNVTPRVGGRFTYYSETTGIGGTNSEHFRGVFDTGAEVSFKASRVWSGAQSKLLDLDGVRHIVEPSVNYVFVPAPNHRPSELPQFDYELASLRLLPIEFPDFNAVDSIDSQNVMRLGLRNTLQTKRSEGIDNLFTWETYTDWRVGPHHGQTTFSDFCSQLLFKPRSWLAFESELRYDVDDEDWRLAYHALTLQPSDRWHWRLEHFYLRDDLSTDPTAWGEGNNLIRSALFYRFNENWGARLSHQFDARDGRMEEQAYTLYRDLRSWTAALTFRMREDSNGSEDFTVALVLSLKAFPRFGLGSDAVRPYSLTGS